MTRFAQTPDAASSAAASAVVVQLLYATPPGIAFAPLIGEVCERAGADLGLTLRLLRIATEGAEMTLGEHRLILTLDRTPPGAAAACLTFGLGTDPEAAGPRDPALVARLTEIARKLTVAVTRRMPADQVLWHIAPQPLSAALLDALTARLPRSLPPVDAEGPEAPVDLLRVMEQVQATLANGLDRGRPQTGPRTDRQTQAGRKLAGPRPMWLTPTIVVPTPEPILHPPANDVPALPRPDQTSRLRSLRALDQVRGLENRVRSQMAERARMRLVLATGAWTASVEAGC